MRTQKPEKTPKQVLVEAKALIEDPKHWVKKKFTYYSKKTGRCYCALGAIRKVAVGKATGYGLYGTPGEKAYIILDEITGSRAVTAWNDSPSTTHKDVMDAFDKAIAVAPDA